MSILAVTKRSVLDTIQNDLLIVEECFDAQDRVVFRKNIDANLITSELFLYDKEDRLIETMTSSSQSGTERRTTEFGENGQVLRRCLYFGDDLFWEEKSQFGENTKHVREIEDGEEIKRQEVTFLDSGAYVEKNFEGNELVYLVEHAVNPDSRLSTTSRFTADRVLLVREEDQWNEKDELLKSSEYNSENELIKEQVWDFINGQYLKTESFNEGEHPEKWKYNYTLNSQNRITGCEVVAENGDIVVVYDVVFDRNGRLESERSYSEEPYWQLPSGAFVSRSFSRRYTYKTCELSAEALQSML